MGAQNFDNLIVIKGNASQAYAKAREQANDYNGHQDGYSGDIQTSNGFRECTKKLSHFNSKSFHDQIHSMQWNMDKGDCKYVEILGAHLADQKSKHGYKGQKGIRCFYFFGVGRI